MGIVYDDLGGVGKTAKARELLDYCERHNKIAELIATIKNARPDLKEVA